MHAFLADLYATAQYLYAEHSGVHFFCVDCLTLYLLCLPGPPPDPISYTVSTRLSVEVEVLIGVIMRYGVL